MWGDFWLDFALCMPQENRGFLRLPEWVSLGNLWYYAVQEKIMSQRMQLILGCLMTAVCLAATGMAWVLLKEGRATNRALVEQTRELTDSVRDSLGRLETGPAVSGVAEDTPLQIRLVQENAEGPPAPLFRVMVCPSISGYPRWDDSVRGESTHGTLSGPDGHLDFGFVKSGWWNLAVWTPSGDEVTYRRFYVRPGKEHEERVTCPSRSIATGGIAFQAELPPDLRNRGLMIAATCALVERKIGDTIWQPERGPVETVKLNDATIEAARNEWRSTFGDMKSKEHNAKAPLAQYLAHTVLFDERSVMLDSRWGLELTPLRGQAPAAPDADDDRWQIRAATLPDAPAADRKRVEWLAGTYRVDELGIARLGPGAARAANDRAQRSVVFLAKDVASGSLKPEVLTTVAAGKQTTLRIEVTEELIRDARANLAELDARPAKKR